MELSKRWKHGIWGLAACGCGWLAALPCSGDSYAAATAPVFLPEAGVFASDVLVTITSAWPTVRFTLDGAEPTTNSPLYTVPLLLTNTTLVQARAFATNGAPGDRAAEAYTLLSTNLAGFTASLPLVIINTFGRPIQHETNAPASVRFIGIGTNGRAAITGPAEVDGRAGIKTRGFSSLRYPKRSFSLETRTAEGESRPVPLLGMPKDSDWILYAPFPDKTLMRDVLAYELSNQLGHYASRTRFVEVFVNNGAGRLDRTNYMGVYVLEEKVKRSEHRVAIHKLSPDDNAEPAITGGYIFKKDHAEEAGGAATTDAPAKGSPFVSRFGFPTGPGGFPADPAAFAPLSREPVFVIAQSVVTNFLTHTNMVGTNAIFIPYTAVTIVATNTAVVTNVVSVTNAAIATNFVVTSNAVIATNVAVVITPVPVTNAVVASQSAAGTNAVATTNTVDPVTAVITTTISIITTTIYRTNFVTATNLVSNTNITFLTNLVAHTNATIVTNFAVATGPVYSTNRFLRTNTFHFQPPPVPAYMAQLVKSGGGFATGQTNAFVFIEPKPSKATPEQRAWLAAYVNRFEQALHGPDFRNPANGYAAYIDVDSFIDHHLFVEATKNIDGFRFSTFFTKDRGAKIRMEPIWDWNLSFGNAAGKQGYLWDRWYWPQLDDQQYSWFRRLFEDPDFAQRYVDRWAEWRANVFTTAHITARIDASTTQIREAAGRNFTRWPIIGVGIGPDYFAGRTWDEDLGYLKSWITNRIAWMDVQFVAQPFASIPPGEISPTNAVALTAPGGEVFFTTDGSDARGVGGAVAPSARTGATPIPLATSMTLTARARKDGRWSAPVTLRYVVKTAAGAGG